MSEHTEGRAAPHKPPKSNGWVLVKVNGDDELATCYSTNAYSNARRIAACWNAFEGVKTEDIEAHGNASDNLLVLRHDLENADRRLVDGHDERERLLDLLQDIVIEADNNPNNPVGHVIEHCVAGVREALKWHGRVTVINDAVGNHDAGEVAVQVKP